MIEARLVKLETTVDELVRVQAEFQRATIEKVNELVDKTSPSAIRKIAQTEYGERAEHLQKLHNDAIKILEELMQSSDEMRQRINKAVA